MKFEPLRLAGAFRVTIEPVSDERGSFARTWCVDEAARVGVNERFLQSSVSVNQLRGTLRGMHFQRAPRMEAKLVRCIRGRIFDAIIDVRLKSGTFGQWHASELSGDAFDALYIPAGFAHGFVTLTDHAVVSYDISAQFDPNALAGLRWDDPDIGIPWPVEPTVISDRDRNLPLLNDMKIED